MATSKSRDRQRRWAVRIVLDVFLHGTREDKAWLARIIRCFDVPRPRHASPAPVIRLAERRRQLEGLGSAK
jgi:hypothetical protein